MLFYNKQRLKQSAEKNVAMGNLEKAIQIYLKILSREPDERDVLSLMGELKIKTNAQAEGLQYFKQAANAYINAGEKPKAITVFKKCLRYDPDNDEVMALMADLQIQAGQTKEGVDSLYKAACAREKDNPSKAIYYLEKTIKIDPENTETIAALGEHYSRQKLTAKAREYNLKAGKKFFDKGDYARSYLHLYEVIQQDPHNAEVNRMVLETLISLKSYEDALLHLNGMSRGENETDLRLLTYRADILFELLRREELLALLHKILMLSPDGHTFLFRYVDRAMSRKNFSLVVDMINLLDMSLYHMYSNKMVEVLNAILSEDENNATALQKLIEFKVYIGDAYGVQALYSKLYNIYRRNNDNRRGYQLLEKWLNLDEENEWIRQEIRRLKLILEEEAHGKADMVRGKIEDIGLADVIQMLESARKTGVLQVRYTDRIGQILFQDGNMFHAIFMELHGADALKELLKLPGGDFMFEPGLPQAPPQSIMGSNTQVVLEALRLIDEERHGQDQQQL